MKIYSKIIVGKSAAFWWHIDFQKFVSIDVDDQVMVIFPLQPCNEMTFTSREFHSLSLKIFSKFLLLYHILFFSKNHLFFVFIVSIFEFIDRFVL